MIISCVLRRRETNLSRCKMSSWCSRGVDIIRSGVWIRDVTGTGMGTNNEGWGKYGDGEKPKAGDGNGDGDGDGDGEKSKTGERAKV